MDSFWYLTVEHVIKLHDEVILGQYGGSSGIRNRDVIESAIEMPKQSFDGVDFYPTIYDKAACYAFHIAEGQGFVDGNKRTAIVVAYAFLEMNDIDLPATDAIQEQLFEALHKITDKSMSKESLAELFRNIHIDGMTNR